jgi:aminoglycoside 6'-N-acetyltransferase I
MWPDEPEAELRRQAEQFFAGRSRHVRAVFLADVGARRAVGFAEVNIRPYAEGCSTDRVAFLEGLYVDPRYRRRGVAAGLVLAAEKWAAKNGCSEFASNALYNNEVSRAVHLALGFKEVEITRYFRKEVEKGDAHGKAVGSLAHRRSAGLARRT